MPAKTSIISKRLERAPVPVTVQVRSLYSTTIYGLADSLRVPPPHNRRARVCYLGRRLYHYILDLLADTQLRSTLSCQACSSFGPRYHWTEAWLGRRC